VDIIVGIIKAPHGIRGEVKVQSFTTEIENIFSYGPLTVEDKMFARSIHSVDSWRKTKGSLIVKLTSINNRNAAEKFRFSKIILDRSVLPEPATGEYYYIDLIGLTAFNDNNIALGIVTSVKNFGGGDILEITPTRGTSFYIPFNKYFVLNIDLDNKAISIIAHR